MSNWNIDGAGAVKNGQNPAAATLDILESMSRSSRVVLDLVVTHDGGIGVTTSHAEFVAVDLLEDRALIEFASVLKIFGKLFLLATAAL